MKLFDANAISRNGNNLTKVGKTSTWLSIGGSVGLNKSKLLSDLPELCQLSIANVKTETRTKKQNAKSWNYYSLTLIGEWYATKKRIEELEEELEEKGISTEDYNHELEKILDNFRETLPYINSRHDKLLNFGTMYYVSLAQSLLSINFGIRSEKYIPFEIFVVTVLLPSNDGFGTSLLESWYPLFNKEKDMDVVHSEWDLASIGIVNPIPLKLKISELSDKFNNSINEQINLDIRNFIIYSFFYYLTRNTMVTTSSMKAFREQSKNILKIKPDSDKIQSAILESGRKLLKSLDRYSAGLTLDQIIEELEQVTKEITDITNEDDLYKILKPIQDQLTQKKNSDLFPQKNSNDKK